MTSLCPRLDFPSSSSSSLPFRPFSYLPTEIIQHIVNSTSSSHYHPDTYVERQTTLLSLCLTSRLFLQLAKPLLYAVVRLKTKEQPDLFRDTEQARAKVIETLELIVAGESFAYRCNNFYPLLATSFGLRKIRLFDVRQEIDLSQLSRLKNLSTLHLSRIEASMDGVKPFTLSNVEELCLRNVSSDYSLEQIFSPRRFPALRVFSLSDPEASTEDITRLLHGLGDQLDLLWIDEGFKPNLALDVFDKVNRKTLFDQGYRIHEAFPNVHSYRLLGPESKLNTLEDLEEIVRTSTTPLPSVFYLAGCHSLDPHDPALEASRQRFRDVCKERDMEVVYESAADWNVDMGRPHEFYRRMRGRKEKSA